jgi:hypothetical protein
MGYSGDIECPECGTEGHYPGECYDCQPFDWAEEEFEKWVARTGARRLRIDGRYMGWQRRSGYAVVVADWKKFLDRMTFNGDWTLRFTFKEDRIDIRRSSHDEPTGAYFEVTPTLCLQDLEDPFSLDIVDEYGCHKLCGGYIYDGCDCIVNEAGEVQNEK